MDAVLAWEDSIGRYKMMKEKIEENEEENGKLREEVEKRSSALQSLERQMTLDKNETRVMSQKKCRNC